MTHAPQTPAGATPDDDDDNDPTGSFYSGIGAVIVGGVVAIAPHTELWAEQITPDAGGRRGWLARLLAGIDPWIFTAAGVVIAVIGALIAVSAFRRGRRMAAEEDAA
ncbi:hypothetical protein FB566_0568 [Stackebrandtia endophytica]|uniref:Uncharacterized protein n=1 Tax=Stackebrandtia endophytica TaxID=1496996 RepID=A0A543ARB5_9ACTN|nr:hypothetical protein [Stackebrandtia endophytica]TQL75076.1 hypothetical protein FB566_0568 [Stackebrandtia endophytica]